MENKAHNVAFLQKILYYIYIYSGTAIRPQTCGLKAIFIFFVERLRYELYFPYLTFKIGLKLTFRISYNFYSIFSPICGLQAQ